MLIPMLAISDESQSLASANDGAITPAEYLVSTLSYQQASSSEVMDEATIRKAWQDYVKAWNKHEAKALAAFYTEDVDRRTNNGKVSKGRAAVAQAIADELRASKNATLSTVQLDIRVITPDVAILDASDELRGLEGAEASVVRTNHTSVFVRKNGKWLTTAIRAWPLMRPAPSPAR